MIFCFGGSLKTHTKCVCLESVRVGHIDTLDTHDPVGAAPYIVSIFPVTLCTTTMVYGGLVHHKATIFTTKPQCAPWCTRETIFFEKFRVPS